MNVCMNACMYLCIYVCVYICRYYVQCVYMRLYVCLCVWCVCVCVCVWCVCMFVRVCVCIQGFKYRSIEYGRYFIGDTFLASVKVLLILLKIYWLMYCEYFFIQRSILFINTFFLIILPSVAAMALHFFLGEKIFTQLRTRVISKHFKIVMFFRV